MPPLQRENLITLTQLSRIQCQEEEIDPLLQDLQSILQYVDLLQEVDTSHVEPCNHVLANVFNAQREDTVGSCLARESLLSNAPDHTEGMIKVPPILKSTP